jgi:hypothetical protein
VRVDLALAHSLTAALPSLAHQVVEATASAVLSAAGQGVGLLRTGLTYGATAAAEAAALAQQLDSASLSEYAAEVQSDAKSVVQEWMGMFGWGGSAAAPQPAPASTDRAEADAQ